MSTPAKIRNGALAAVALACCLAAVIAVASGALGGQFQAIGNRDAPAVDSTTGLYYAVSDMDAQVGNALLDRQRPGAGRGPAAGSGPLRQRPAATPRQDLTAGGWSPRSADSGRPAGR